MNKIKILLLTGMALILIEACGSSGETIITHGDN